MKTFTIIMTVLFTLQVSVLFAGNESAAITGAPVESALDMTSLIPVIPAEATFEEVNSDVIDYSSVAPVVPAEAQFEDVIPVFDMGHLAPVVPAEADFSDSVYQDFNNSSLAPSAPSVADFE